jgi:hypothetical protein
MEKLIQKLDEIFAKYGVEENDVAAVGDIIAEIGGGEIAEVEGDEDFIAPAMGGDYVTEDE